MKQFVWISMVAAGMLLAGCSDEKAEAPKAAAPVVEEKAAPEVVKHETATLAPVVEKQAHAKVVAEAKAAVEETKAKVVEAVAEVKGTAEGAALYAKCAACHGQNGTSKALGKSAIIAGQSAADLEASMKGYQAGTRNISGMGGIMRGQVAGLSESDIKVLAAYISDLK